MKKSLFISGLLVLITTVSAYASSMVRIKCEDQDSGTEVFINGKFVGECPCDVPVKAGKAKLLARKTVQNGYEQIFEKDLRVVDDVVQRIDITLSAPQVSVEARQKAEADEVRLKKDAAIAEARLKKEEAKIKLKNEATEAATQLSAAEAGDVEAMKKMIGYYEDGIGVKKSPAKAATWRNKVEASTAQEQLRAANAGNFEAMKNIAVRYDTGQGVVKDPSQAKEWRNKAEAIIAQEQISVAKTGNFEAIENVAVRYDTGQGLNKDPTKAQEWRDYAKKLAENQQAQQAKAQARQMKIYNFTYFENTDHLFKRENIITALASLPMALASDILSLPKRSSELDQIRNEAAFRPSTWGNPDSMIAHATRRHTEKELTTEAPLLIVATK